MSDTPRTDNFLQTQPALRLDPADFINEAAMMRTAARVREVMIGYSEFARQLEREAQPHA